MSLLNSAATIFNHFNTLDYAFITLMVVAMIAGGLKGFCKQVISWFFWILAAYVAYFYSTDLADMFLRSYVSSYYLRLIIVDVLLLLSALVVSFVVNRLMQGMLSLTGMSVFDRFLGVYFGLMQGVVLIAVVVTGFSTTTVKHEDWWRGSRVVAMTSTLMPIYAEDMMKMIDWSLRGMNEVWSRTLGDQFAWQLDPAKE